MKKLTWIVLTAMLVSLGIFYSTWAANSPATWVDTHSHTGGANGAALTGKAITKYNAGVPALSAFSQVNVTGMTITETSGANIKVTGVGTASTNYGLLCQAIPSVPYRVVAYVDFASVFVGNPGAAIGFRDSGTGKFTINGMLYVSSSPRLYGQKFTNPTTYSGDIYTTSASVGAWGGYWLGARQDATKVYYEVSPNGTDWIILGEETKSTGYLGSSGYNENCFIVANGGLTSSYSFVANLYVWDVNGLSRPEATP